MLKAAGLTLLFLCICLVGVFAADNLSKRARALDNIVSSLKRYKTLVLHTGKEISELLPESFSKLAFLDFEGGVPEIREPNPLNREDKDLLSAFFSGAGEDIKQGETQKCDMYIETFKSRKAAAQKDLGEKRKIYIVSAVCSAAAAVVFFI